MVELDVAKAEEIIDLTRDAQVHGMATPTDEAGKLNLGNKIVATCERVYRGGEGNTEPIGLKVMELAGLMNGGTDDASSAEAAIAAEVGEPAQGESEHAGDEPGTEAGAQGTEPEAEGGSEAGNG